MKQNMLVRLLIPDNIAITTFHTLKRMGFSSLKKISRQDYYGFEGDLGNGFSERIAKVDMLVNANKHKATISEKLPATKKTGGCYEVHVLVKSADNDCGGLLGVLKNRLGFSQIKQMERGVFWTLQIDVKTESEAKKTAQQVAQGLLANEQFQHFEIY